MNGWQRVSSTVSPKISLVVISGLCMTTCFQTIARLWALAQWMLIAILLVRWLEDYREMWIHACYKWFTGCDDFYCNEGTCSEEFGYPVCTCPNDVYGEHCQIYNRKILILLIPLWRLCTSKIGYVHRMHRCAWANCPIKGLDLPGCFRKQWTGVNVGKLSGQRLDGCRYLRLDVYKNWG